MPERRSSLNFAPLSAAKLGLLLFCIGAGAGRLEAQDERSVKSPDGKLAFHIFVALEKPGGYDRVAYTVYRGDKPVIDTSFIGFDMLEQEPLLGEKAGLLESKNSSHGAYNSLTTEYLQDGSVGRRLQVEARVWNDAVAFRCRFPRTTAQAEFLLVEEYTEFAFPPGARTAEGQPLAALVTDGQYAFPFLADEPDVGWVGVTEIPAPPYPKVQLQVEQKSVMVTQTARPQPHAQLAANTVTPLDGPWRVVLVGKDRAQVLDSPILKELSR